MQYRRPFLSHLLLAIPAIFTFAACGSSPSNPGGTPTQALILAPTVRFSHRTPRFPSAQPRASSSRWGAITLPRERSMRPWLPSAKRSFVVEQSTSRPGTYTESVLIEGDGVIIGGYDDNWCRSQGDRSRVEATMPVAMTIKGDAEVVGFELVGGDHGGEDNSALQVQGSSPVLSDLRLQGGGGYSSNGLQVYGNPAHPVIRNSEIHGGSAQQQSAGIDVFAGIVEVENWHDQRRGGPDDSQRQPLWRLRGRRRRANRRLDDRGWRKGIRSQAPTLSLLSARSSSPALWASSTAALFAEAARSTVLVST